MKLGGNKKFIQKVSLIVCFVWIGTFFSKAVQFNIGTAQYSIDVSERMTWQDIRKKLAYLSATPEFSFQFMHTDCLCDERKSLFVQLDSKQNVVVDVKVIDPIQVTIIDRSGQSHEIRVDQAMMLVDLKQVIARYLEIAPSRQKVYLQDFEGVNSLLKQEVPVVVQLKDPFVLYVEKVAL